MFEPQGSLIHFFFLFPPCPVVLHLSHLTIHFPDFLVLDFALPSTGLTTVPSLPGRASVTEPGVFFHLISVGFSFHLYGLLSAFLGTALVCIPMQDLWVK